MSTRYKILFLLCAVTYLISPLTSVKAETLKDYKNLLEKYENEQKANQAEINKTEGAIASSKAQIENIKREIQNMTEEVQKMEEEVIESDNLIKEKSLETKQLFEYLQVSQSENLYLEYAFDATTMTDLIYRVSIVQQLTEYNDNLIKELEALIESNKKKTIELENKQVEMEQKQQSLTTKITQLTGVKASLNENSVSVKQQIKIYQDIVKSYKDAGCKDNDVIGRDCAVTNSVAGWYRPIESGYVTSEFGYRWGSLHRAVDVSNKSPYSTKIYPVANGTIKAKYYDSYGALTIVLEHKTASGKYYSSLYTHMSKYAPNLYVGKTVKTTDYLGYMGETGLAYGPHLHLEIAPCRLYTQSDKNCGSWSKYTKYVSNIYNSGTFKGPRDLIYFPKKGVTFKGR